MRVAGSSAALLLVVATTACAPAAEPAPTPSPSGFDASWPAVPGRVLTRVRSSDEIVERVAVQDSEAAYARVKTLLTGAGFLLTKDRPGTGGGDGQACSPESGLCVSFTATEGVSGGPTVVYEVFRSSGIAAPP